MYATKTFFALALTAGLTSSVLAQSNLDGLDPYYDQEGNPLLPQSAETSTTANLISTFNLSKEGWRVKGDVNPIVWKSAGGNPGGFIEATDQSNGIIWYFVSPLSWAGNRINYKKLSFDLKQVGNGSGVIDNDLIIVGNNGKKLFWKGERPPAQNWTSYSISLDPIIFKVTQQYYDSIMSSVNNIMIRGEFISGPDVGGLDNVVLSETPEKVRGTTFGLGSYSVVCKNNRTQQIVKIISTVKLDWNCEAMGLTVNDGDSVVITITGNAAK